MHLGAVPFHVCWRASNGVKFEGVHISRCTALGGTWLEMKRFQKQFHLVKDFVPETINLSGTILTEGELCIALCSLWMTAVFFLNCGCVSVYGMISSGDLVPSIKCFLPEFDLEFGSRSLHVVWNVCGKRSVNHMMDKPQIICSYEHVVASLSLTSYSIWNVKKLTRAKSAQERCGFENVAFVWHFSTMYRRMQSTLPSNCKDTEEKKVCVLLASGSSTELYNMWEMSQFVWHRTTILLFEFWLVGRLSWNLMLWLSAVLTRTAELSTPRLLCISVGIPKDDAFCITCSEIFDYLPKYRQQILHFHLSNLLVLAVSACAPTCGLPRDVS